MLQIVRDLQDRAVRELICLTNDGRHTSITFKAPTGSGKTYMMAKFMNEILGQDSDVIFLVSSLSKGGLAKQNFDKFSEYKLSGSFENLKPYLINTEVSNEERIFIPLTHNVYVLPRDLYKRGGRLMQGAMEGFLKSFAPSIFNMDSKKIYLIKDECHIATKNLDALSKYFDKIYNFSATPNLARGQVADVEITNVEAESAKLIKGIKPGNATDTIDVAIDEYLDIKDRYENLLGVTPCLIIQISNKDKADEEIKNILPVLSVKGLKWILMVDKEKECMTNDDMGKGKNKLPVSKWREYAKSNSSTINVIIFKLTISEGWDIPRACMLYQVRDVKSEQLNEQVVGRVRRNPRLLDFEKLSDEAKTLAMTAWVWGDIEEKNDLCGVTLRNSSMVQDEIKVKTTVLKKLANKAVFNLENIIKNKNNLVPTNIFILYRNYKASNQSVQELCKSYSNTYENWRKFTENIKDISTDYNKYICNYNESMELAKDENDNEKVVSLPKDSYYVGSNYKTDISDCVWVKVDASNDFSFDSEAERKWAEVLKSLCSKNLKSGTSDRIVKTIDGVSENYLWGKNYLPNSDIKYEYYLNGRHFSYPDFIMKDACGNIHIFEVKSINKSKNINIDDGEDYKEKVRELKNCYKRASLLTKNIFYLPLLVGSEWQITRYKDGEEENLTYEMFEESLR